MPPCSSGALKAGEVSTSQLSLSPFALPPAFIWTKGLKQRLGLGAGKVVLMSVSAPAWASLHPGRVGVGGCSGCSRERVFWSGVLAKQRKTV